MRRTLGVRTYWCALFPTTNRQYELMAGARPDGSLSADDEPAYMVSLSMLRGDNAKTKPAFGGTWPNCDNGSFFSNLNARVSLGEALAGYRFDVPSAAQWEIACRAGTAATWYNGLDYDTSISGFAAKLGEIARYANAKTTSRKVTARQPNPWGFYDFIGNTREWIRDYVTHEVPLDEWRNSTSADDGCVHWNNTASSYCWSRGGYEDSSAQNVRTCEWEWEGGGTSAGTSFENGFRIVCTYFGD